MSNWQDLTTQAMQACLDSFAEQVDYTPSGLSSRPINAIFDHAYQSVDPNTGAIIISEQPMIGVKSDDLPNPPHPDDRVVIRGDNYRIVDSQPDGWAGIKILLHKL